jgi:hypothetical protein
MSKFETPHLYWNELVILKTSFQLLELNHSLFIYSNHTSQITCCTYYNILKHMQFNILQLCLNGLIMILFTFLELSTFLHESNHPL